MSIFKRAMASAFDHLHPMIKKRFGFDSADGIACIGRGVMDEMRRGSWWTVPFLRVGTWRSIMFPDTGTDIPFSVHNYAYKDSYGRETVTWVRIFEFPHGQRRFDATMIYAESRGRIVDYIGNHQHLAVDMECTVDSATGGIRLRSGQQRFFEGRVKFRFPRFLSGDADVVEWYDDGSDEYRIAVEVRNRFLGLLFAYQGRFQVQFIQTNNAAIPDIVKPLREERRE